MWQTNLKVLIVVVATVTLYTAVASWIPQVESEVPEELSFSGEVTTDELVEAGEALYEGAGGCIACHGSGTRAPNLLTDEGGTGTIGVRCGERVPTMDCKQYLHASMVDPGAYVVEGYQAIMPDARRTLSDAQIWSLVAYLQSQGGEVTVEADDVQESAAETGPGRGTQIAPDTEPAGGSGTTDPVALLGEHACLACHRLGDEGGPIGPAFDDIGATRTPDHIRRSILDPNAETTEGYEATAGTMPTTFGQQMTAEQLEALVRFLSEQTGGE